MLRTILVPLDGSLLSERAVPFAQGIASRAGAKLLLMRAVPLAKPRFPGAYEFNEAAIARAETELAAVIANLGEPSVPTESFLSHDDAGCAIVDAAEKQADLVVMSTHGRTGLGRAMYGSVADQVVRTASVPVLLIPPTAAFSLHPPFRIVVPLDGSELAEKSLAPALDLADALRGEVVLVRVAEPPTYWVLTGSSRHTIADPESEMERARRYLDAVAQRYSRPGVAISGFATDGMPEEVIVEAAREHCAGAIAMATHGRSGVARLAMGSVAEKVLRGSSVPVLLVRSTTVGQEHVHVPRDHVAGSGG